MNGLPDLPAGEWWEVRKDAHGYKVCIVENVKTPKHKKRGRWGFRITVPASEEVKVIDSYPIIDEDLESKTFITPKDVRETANKLLRRREIYAENRVKKAQSNALLGAYPPKTLP